MVTKVNTNLYWVTATEPFGHTNLSLFKGVSDKQICHLLISKQLLTELHSTYAFGVISTEWLTMTDFTYIQTEV